MTEGVLIEMAHRFRKLERLLERADLFLKAKQERHEVRISDLDLLLKEPERYESTCRAIASEERKRDEVRDLREDVQKALDSCRADIDAMQDELRSLGACSK